MIVWLLTVMQSLPFMLGGQAFAVFNGCFGLRDTGFRYGYGERGIHMKIFRFYPFSGCK
ncbi:hypothetical protein [Lacrimispora sp.]|uniref:hypothetical protein n=1 Tax=Lacrimispora sp. TaxID=2719234 RepID=UPI002FD8B22F